MNGLITRGLRKIGYNSLVTRGFEAISVIPPIVERPAGSVTRLMNQNYISKSLYYNIDGQRLYQRTLSLFLKGILAFYEITLYNIVGLSKHLSNYAKSLGCYYGLNVISSHNLLAKKNYFTEVDFTLLGKTKILTSCASDIFVINAFYRTSEASIISKVAYIVGEIAPIIGNKKFDNIKDYVISGKKNITNILAALGLLDSKTKE